MKLWHEIFILLFVVFYGTLGIVLLGTWMWQVAGTSCSVIEHPLGGSSEVGALSGVPPRQSDPGAQAVEAVAE